MLEERQNHDPQLRYSYLQSNISSRSTTKNISTTLLTALTMIYVAVTNTTPLHYTDRVCAADLAKIWLITQVQHPWPTWGAFLAKDLLGV